MGVIVGRQADAGEGPPGQRFGGELARPVPGRPAGAAGERAVAGEGELAAAAGAHRPLVDDAADAVRPGRMADPVDHHLGDRALAVLALRRRLVIDGLGEAIERAHLVERGGRVQRERRCGRVEAAGERDRRVGGERRRAAQQHRLRDRRGRRRRRHGRDLGGPARPRPARRRPSARSAAATPRRARRGRCRGSVSGSSDCPTPCRLHSG